MDTRAFDDLPRRVGIGIGIEDAGQDRRRFLKVMGAGLAALAAGAGGQAPLATAARCLSEGEPCRRRGQCCSGRCQGPKGKKTCRARGEGTCKQGQDICRADPNDLPGCNGRDNCGCFVTTGGTSFCSSGAGDCARCQSDADCVARGFPNGSACVRADRGSCGEFCSGRSTTACVAPCGFEPPVDDLDAEADRIAPGLLPAR